MFKLLEADQLPRSGRGGKTMIGAGAYGPLVSSLVVDHQLSRRS